VLASLGGAIFATEPSARLIALPLFAPPPAVQHANRNGLAIATGRYAGVSRASTGKRL
jgi:hypothetical protein